jgi:hypothetical protein
MYQIIYQFEYYLNHIERFYTKKVRKNLFLKYESTTRKLFKRDQLELLVGNILSVNKNSKKVNFEKIIYPSLMEEDLMSCENIFNI